jgi:hypothetical protein
LFAFGGILLLGVSEDLGDNLFLIISEILDWVWV